MKKISLSTIAEFLTIEKIEEILTHVLIHNDTESALKNLPESKRWLEDKEIWISSVSSDPQFSNENWLYYFDTFKELQPRKLSIHTTKLSQIPKIEEIISLREVFIGTSFPKNYQCFGIDETKDLLRTLIHIPKIQRISLGMFIVRGSAADHMNAVQECLNYAKSYFPNCRLSKKDDYSPFTFIVEKETAVVQ